MKNLFTLLLFSCLFIGCSDDTAEATFENDKVATTTSPTTSTFASNPEANSAFDNSYKGIYKGIVIGNVSGALYVDILNDGKIWAKFQTDDQRSYALDNISIVDAEEQNSTSVSTIYRFANENMSFEITLDENGNNITTSNFHFFTISSSRIWLLKEKSNSLLKCYTGTFRRQNEKGSVNFISDGQSRVSGLSKKTTSNQMTTISGQINLIYTNNEATKVGDGGNEGSPTPHYQLKANLHIGEIIGYLNRNKFEGYWMNEGNEIGSWSSTRIL